MGSLFKARDFWQYRCGDNEEFDRHSLVVANIDNDATGLDKIIVGSLHGTLRIFQPKQKGFRPDDLLLEQELDGPILQLAAGRFLSTSQNLLIAVLNPKKLAVYIVQRSGAGGAEGTQDPLGRQYLLTKQYEQLLERCAYNFVYGPFGGAAGRDHICIQTMDGQLNFFEQEKFLFTRFLSNPQGQETSFLLPGPMCFNSQSDSFITSTSTFEVHSYRYTTFASSSGSQQKEGADGRKLRCDWSVNVGEDVIDIRIARFTQGQPGQSYSYSGMDIIVLADRTLFVIRDTGEIRAQKRLDFFPSCVYPYLLDGRHGDKVHNLLVGTHTAQLMVYSDQKLMWSAKTNSSPVSVGVGNFAKLDGLIVVIGDDGVLSCNYLGTDPATQPAQLLDTSRELDYDDMDEEHRQLQQLIRQAVNAGKTEPDNQIVLQYECPSQLDDGSEKTCTVNLFLHYQGEENVENLSITVAIPQPFCLAGGESTIAIDGVQGGSADPLVVPLVFTVSPDPTVAALSPVSLQTEVICCYSSPLGGEPLTSRTSFFLPLALAGSIIPPVKNPSYKITLETNHPPPALPTLFDDVVSGSGEATSTNVLSFQYNNSNDATILVSKSANRFRLQASAFESLWLLTAELVRRLKIYFGSQPQQEPLTISYGESLPFQDYFAAIDVHFRARQALTQSQQVLSERAHQFRSIQKRLLVRFKDRNPSPLQNLDKLFEKTYQQLLKLSEFVDEHQNALTKSSNALACATHLILLLIQYRFEMRKDDIKILKHYLSPIVVDSATQGWEECTDAAMTHLLRTSLAKSAKEATSMPQPLAVPPDTGKLKKHIALVCDRLAKGGSLKGEQGGGAKGKSKDGKGR